MKRRSSGWIIGIVILALLSMLTLGGCKKNPKEEQDGTGLKESIQEEMDESESGTFEEIFSTEKEEDESDVGASDTSEQEKPATEGGSKENVVQDSNNNNKNDNNKNDSNKNDGNENNSDVKDNDEKGESEEKEHITGNEEDTEGGWGPII